MKTTLARLNTHSYQSLKTDKPIYSARAKVFHSDGLIFCGARKKERGRGGGELYYNFNFQFKGLLVCSTAVAE